MRRGVLGCWGVSGSPHVDPGASYAVTQQSPISGHSNTFLSSASPLVGLTEICDTQIRLC